MDVFWALKEECLSTVYLWGNHARVSWVAALPALLLQLNQPWILWCWKGLFKCLFGAICWEFVLTLWECIAEQHSLHGEIKETMTVSTMKISHSLRRTRIAPQRKESASILLLLPPSIWFTVFKLETHSYTFRLFTQAFVIHTFNGRDFHYSNHIFYFMYFFSFPLQLLISNL